MDTTSGVEAAPSTQTSGRSLVDGGRRTRGFHKPAGMTGRPLITVASVVFNAGADLRQALQCVLSQTYPNIELIVIDGGSTDMTLQVIRQFDQDIDYWISEPDSGIYNAMNKALAIAKGDWLIFLGADDFLSADLERIAPSLTNRNSVYYGNVRLKSSGRCYAGKFSKYKLMQQNICHQSIFYPRSIYKDKPYDEQCGILADHKYNLELVGSGTSFSYLEEEVAVFNDAGASSTGDRDFEARKLRLIYENFGVAYFAIKWIRNLAVKVLKGSPA